MRTLEQRKKDMERAKKYWERIENTPVKELEEVALNFLKDCKECMEDKEFVEWFKDKTKSSLRRGELAVSAFVFPYFFAKKKLGWYNSIMESYLKKKYNDDVYIREFLENKKFEVWIQWQRDENDPFNPQKFMHTAWVITPGVEQEADLNPETWTPQKWHKIYKIYMSIPTKEREELEKIGREKEEVLDYWFELEGQTINLHPHEENLKKKGIDPYDKEKIVALFYKEMKDVFKMIKEKGYKNILEYAEKEKKVQKKENWDTWSIELEGEYIYSFVHDNEKHSDGLRIWVKDDESWYIRDKITNDGDEQVDVIYHVT